MGIPEVDDVPEKLRAVGTALGVTDPASSPTGVTKREIDVARALVMTATSKPKVAYLNVRGGGTQRTCGSSTAGAALTKLIQAVHPEVR
jgi:ABC-type hemin transport system substrate-binding protein